MTQSLLGFGTGTVNFFGRYAYDRRRRGRLRTPSRGPSSEEPQAALGSHLQSARLPRQLSAGTLPQDHGVSSRRPTTHHAHRPPRPHAPRRISSMPPTAPAASEVFDLANVDQKGFSERVVTAPVSPLGQRLWVRTKFATSVILTRGIARPWTRCASPTRTTENLTRCRAWSIPTTRSSPSLAGLLRLHVYVTDTRGGPGQRPERRHVGGRQSRLTISSTGPAASCASIRTASSPAPRTRLLRRPGTTLSGRARNGLFVVERPPTPPSPSSAANCQPPKPRPPAIRCSGCASPRARRRPVPTTPSSATPTVLKVVRPRRS